MEFPVVANRGMPGASPACDAAICAVVAQQNSEVVPLLLYEYKPAVDPRFEYINIHDLMEVVLQ